MMETVSDLRCRLRHVRAAGLCHKGSRLWCEANSVNWQDFITKGISSQVLLDSGDPIVRRVVEEAKREQGG